MYSALLAFGIEGYQRLFGQFLEVSYEFRKQLVAKIPEVDIVNPDNYAISTVFRIYPPQAPRFQDEVKGTCSIRDIEQTNLLNERLFEKLGQQRDQMFFGDTKKHLIVNTLEDQCIPLYVSKFFVISPHTKPELVTEVVDYLKACVTEVYEQFVSTVK
jgi:glutamate/tyrosine decarboxylase-like PLP-dependent enzyme